MSTEEEKRKEMLYQLFGLQLPSLLEHLAQAVGVLAYIGIGVLITYILGWLVGFVIVGPFSDPVRPVTIEQRIETLTGSLKAASETIADIEKEINSRKALVTQLQNDAATAKGLIALNKEQVEAVSQALRHEISEAETKNFWTGLATNFAFTLLGFGLSEGWRWWRGR
jgi:hypothetical protein